MNLTEFYTNRKTQYEAVNDELNTHIFWLGWARLAIFIILATCIYFFFKSEFQYGWLVAAIGLFASFLFLVKYNEKLLDRREVMRHLIRINGNELTILKNEPSYLNDGSVFESDESYLLDLDIFGPRSMFHLLNRTATNLGESRLASVLKKPFKDIQTIENQQITIQKLAAKVDFRQTFLAQALRTRSNPPDHARLLAWAESAPEFYYATYIRVVRILMPTLALASLIYGIVTFNFTFFSFVFILNFFIAGRYGMKITKIHAAVSKNVESLGVFAELFTLINQENFNTNILQKIYDETMEAHQELKRLGRIANFFDQRLNMIIYTLFTGLFVYDLQCVFWLEQWKVANRDKLRRWLHAVGEIELLNSLATFHFNNPAFIFPKLTEGTPYIEATALAHPLMPAHQRVSNDFQIGKNKTLYLITGSNMSGKSTFLRTVGMNVLLARCGAPVCATHFEGTAMDIYSSLRQSDSLQDNVSLFFAELRKLQTILQHLSENSNALVLLDEVLRGTNSDDKLYGSQQLVKKLLHFNSVSLLATHDIELSKMETEFPEQLGNLCFESIIAGEELIFDYKLKTGTAQNRNATFLMRKMGIIGG